MLQPTKKIPTPDEVLGENKIPTPQEILGDTLKKKESTESTSTIPENNSESVQTIGSLDGVGSNGFPAIDQNLGVPGLKPDLKTVEQLANPPKSNTDSTKPIKKFEGLIPDKTKGFYRQGEENVEDKKYIDEGFSNKTEYVAEEGKLVPKTKTTYVSEATKNLKANYAKEIGRKSISEYDPNLTEENLQREKEQSGVLNTLGKVGKYVLNATGESLSAWNEALGGDEGYFTIDQYEPLQDQKKQAKKDLQREGLPITEEAIQKRAEDIFRKEDRIQQIQKRVDANLPEDYDREGIWKELKLDNLKNNDKLRSAVATIDINKKQIDDFNKYAAYVNSLPKEKITQDKVDKYNKLLAEAQDSSESLEYYQKTFPKLLKEVKSSDELLDVMKFNYNDYEKAYSNITGLGKTIAMGSLKLAGETANYTDQILGREGQDTGYRQAIIDVANEELDKNTKDKEQYIRYKAKDINSFSDGGSFMAQLGTEQLPVYATLVLAPEIGLPLLGSGTAGEQFRNMEVEEMQPFAKQTTFGQKLATAYLYGSAETLFERLGTVSVLKNIEKSIARASNASRKLIYEGAAKESTKLAKRLGLNTAIEGGTEYLTAEAQIGADKYVSGKNISSQQANERRFESTVAGGLMGGSMTLMGGVWGSIAQKAKLYSENKDIKETKAILSQIDLLSDELKNNPNLNAEDKKIIYDKMNDLTNKSFDIVIKNSEKGKNFSAKENQFLVDINVKQDQLKQKFEELKNSNISTEQKELLVKDLNNQYAQLEKDRNSTLKGEFETIPDIRKIITFQKKEEDNLKDDQALINKAKPKAEVPKQSENKKVIIPDEIKDEHSRALEGHQESIADLEKKLAEEKALPWLKRDKQEQKWIEEDIKFHKESAKMLEENPVQYYKDFLKSEKASHENRLKEGSEDGYGKTYKDLMIERFGSTDFETTNSRFIEDINSKIAKLEDANKPQAEVPQQAEAEKVAEVSPEVADVEKRRQAEIKKYDERDARSLEAITPNNPNHPTFKVGMKVAHGMNIKENLNADNWNGEGKGYTVITAVKESAEFGEDGKMTKVAKVETAIFNSKEEADAAIQATFEKAKNLAGKAQEKANAKYDAELEALKTKETPKSQEVSPVEDVVAKSISKEEYADFVDNNNVSDERLNSISEKVKNQEKLSEQENAIFVGKTSEINKIIADAGKKNGDIAPNGNVRLGASNVGESGITEQESPQADESKKDLIEVYHGGTIKEISDINREAYFSRDKEQAKEYARGNDGKVRKFLIDKNKIGDEEVVRQVINELELEPKEKDEGWVFDDLNLYEIIDTKFESSLSESDQKVLFDELKKRGFQAIEFTDMNLKTLKNDIQNIVVLDKSIISKNEKAPKSNSAANRNVQPRVEPMGESGITEQQSAAKESVPSAVDVKPSEAENEVNLEDIENFINETYLKDEKSSTTTEADQGAVKNSNRENRAIPIGEKGKKQVKVTKEGKVSLQGRKALAKRQFKGDRKTASQIDPTDATSLALRYFVNGGKISSDYFNSQGERQARSNGLHGIAAKEAKTAKGEKATIDAVAHEIWESQENSELKLSTEDIKNAVEEVVNGNLTVQDAVASILGKYNVEEQNDADYEKDYAQAIQEYQQEENYSEEHIQEVESVLDYLSDAEIIELANSQEKSFDDYTKDLESRQVTYDLGAFSERGTIQPDGWILSENGELLSPQSVRNVKQVNPYIEVGILSEFGNIGKEGVVTLLKAIKAQLSMESGGVGKPFGVNIWTNEQGEIKYVGNNAKRSKGLIQNTFAFDLNDNLLKEKSIINSKEALKAVEEVISNIPEKLEVKTPISKDTPELKEVNSKLEKANEKLRIAKEALDRKAKSLDKELLKDNEDIFGERKTQNENKLFDERVDGNARNKATEKERQAIKDAQKEVKDLTEAKSKIESGEINSTKQMVFDEVDRIAQKIKDILPGIDDPDLKKQGISQDDLIDLVANAVKALVSKGIDINDAIRQVVASIKERFNVEVDEKLVKEKIGVEKPKSKTKNPLREKSSEEIADELGISEKDYLDLKAFVANEPSSGIFNEYLSADTIADVFGDGPTNDQQYEQKVLLNAVQHGNSVLEKARSIFGENYMSKTLEFLQNVKLGNFEKAMVYAALENEIDTLVKSNPSNKVFLATQRLIYADSQANLRNSSKGLNAGRLRRIHNAIKNGYDIDKLTIGLIKPEQQEAKQILKDAIPTGDNLNKASEQEENTEIEKPRVYTQQEFEVELKKAVQASVGKSRNDLSKKGKDIADKIRRLKLNKDVAKADLSLGAYDLAIEAIAQLVEKGSTVAQAIKNVLSDVKYKDIDADKLRQDILGVVNTPRIKDVVKQALIDAGFSREITVTKNAKDENGNDIIENGKKVKIKETKEVLDWNKLTGRMNSVEALRANVEGKLKEQGYTNTQIEEISNELETEYKRLTEYIADKALTELERRNQIPKPVNRKSDLDRLVDYHNKGLFGESAKGYERLINKIVGITKREQDVLDKIESEIEKIKNLREVKIDGSFPDAQSIESQASYIAKSIRNIIAWSNLMNSRIDKQIIDVISDIAGISRAAVLGNLYNAFQNIYSNNRAGFLARMKFKAKGYWTPELNDVFNELKKSVTSDVLINRGLDFGDVVSPFSNHSIFIEKLKDYIEKKYPEGRKRRMIIGALNTFEGRLFLNVMDSRFKSKIVNIDFVINLVDVLTSERAGKSKMTKEEAVNFVSESLTGVNLEKAKVLAKKFINDVNAMKENTLLENEDNIKRLAFDIVRENLTSGNNFTMDEINDIYQASMKSGGANIGHESNNIISESLKNLNNWIEKKVEDAMKEKDYDKATKYATYAFISKNITYPYMSGGFNWVVLEAEAGTPLGLATGAYKSYKNKNIDLLTDVGRKRMKEDLVNKRDAESKLFRGIWGTSIGVAAYLAYYGLQAVSGVGDDDEENKRISNKYLREHPEQRKIFDKFSPEVYAVSLSVSDERLSKYLLNKMGYKTDQNDNVLTLLKSLQNKNSSTPGALGVLLGQIVSTPGAWRILRDSKRLFRELQGEPMAQTEQRVTSFLNGYFKGALVDYLGLRPGTNYDLEKVKKEIQNKKTDFTNYTNGIANDINSGKITKEDAAKLVNKKYEDNDELLDKAKEIIQNSVNDKEIREGLKDADIWYMEMHNEKDIRAKAYIYYQNELKNNASKTDKNFDEYMNIALYGIDEDYYKKFIDLAIEYKDVEEQKSKKKPIN